MNRRLLILEFALSSLLRHRYKTLAAMLAYTLVVFLWSSVLMLGQGLKEEARAVLAGSPQLIVQRISGGRQITVPAEYGTTIAGIRGVRSVKPRCWGYYYDPPTGTNYTVIGADVFPGAELTMAEGKFYRGGRAAQVRHRARCCRSAYRRDGRHHPHETGRRRGLRAPSGRCLHIRVRPAHQRPHRHEDGRCAKALRLASADTSPTSWSRWEIPGRPTPSPARSRRPCPTPGPFRGTGSWPPTTPSSTGDRESAA